MSMILSATISCVSLTRLSGVSEGARGQGRGGEGDGARGQGRGGKGNGARARGSRNAHNRISSVRRNVMDHRARTFCTRWQRHRCRPFPGARTGLRGRRSAAPDRRVTLHAHGHQRACRVFSGHVAKSRVHQRLCRCQTSPTPEAAGAPAPAAAASPRRPPGQSGRPSSSPHPYAYNVGQCPAISRRSHRADSRDARDALGELVERDAPVP